MFGTNLLDRRSKPERIADQAWVHLPRPSYAGDSVRDTARSARRNSGDLADGAGDLVGSAAKEQRLARSALAFDALAGRQPALPCTLLIGAALVGAAVGWAVGSAARAAGSHDDRAVDDVEFVDVDRPDSPAV